MFFPGATSITDSRIHDNKVPDILKCSCGYHSNTRQHVRTCQICNIVYPIKIVDVAFMVFQELGDQQWQIIYYNPFLLTKLYCTYCTSPWTVTIEIQTFKKRHISDQKTVSDSKGQNLLKRIHPMRVDPKCCIARK